MMRLYRQTIDHAQTQSMLRIVSFAIYYSFIEILALSCPREPRGKIVVGTSRAFPSSLLSILPHHHKRSSLVHRRAFLFVTFPLSPRCSYDVYLHFLWRESLWIVVFRAATDVAVRREPGGVVRSS